jgi:esterase/lipase
MKDIEARLDDVKAPTMIVQAQEDPVVNQERTSFLFNRIGADNKQYLSLDFSRHGIVAGAGSEEVHAAISAFIGKL